MEQLEDECSAAGATRTRTQQLLCGMELAVVDAVESSAAVGRSSGDGGGAGEREGQGGARLVWPAVPHSPVHQGQGKGPG